MAHHTFFKHDMETRAESKERRDKEADAELAACYADVDARDQKCSRRSGIWLTPGHVDAAKRLERHHMRRPAGSIPNS